MFVANGRNFITKIGEKRKSQSVIIWENEIKIQRHCFGIAYRGDWSREWTEDSREREGGVEREEWGESGGEAREETIYVRREDNNMRRVKDDSSTKPHSKMVMICIYIYISIWIILHIKNICYIIHNNYIREREKIRIFYE